jgi:hypothetical protein
MITFSPEISQAVSAAEFRDHSKIPATTVPGAPTDTRLNLLLQAAQQYFETRMEQLLGVRTATQQNCLDTSDKVYQHFEADPIGPVGVYVANGAGGWTALDAESFFVKPNRVVFFNTTLVPESTNGAANIQLVYQTGLAARAMEKNAILELAAHYYENTEATSAINISEVPLSAERAADLLRAYRGGW